MATVRYAIWDVKAALLRAASWLYAQGRTILWLRRRSAAAAVALCIGLQAGAALAADPTELNRLAARCAVCHSATAQATSPLLDGQPEAYFISQMRAFRERRRTNPPMVAFANELNDQEVSALASYYAAREPAQVDPLASPAQIEAGKSKAAALRCAQCHGAALQGFQVGRGTAGRTKAAVHGVDASDDEKRNSHARLSPRPAAVRPVE